MEDTQMPTANEDKAPDPVLNACNEYYVSYKKAAEGSETQHKLIMALNNHILDQKSKIKELEWLMTKTAQDAKEQHDYHVQHHKQMLELNVQLQHFFIFNFHLLECMAASKCWVGWDRFGWGRSTIAGTAAAASSVRVFRLPPDKCITGSSRGSWQGWAGAAVGVHTDGVGAQQSSPNSPRMSMSAMEPAPAPAPAPANSEPKS